jgi:curved DNA-binding protein CbpA
MAQSSLSLEWFKQFTDPYAVLGISVTADDRRVLKRYRDIAKLLHPDRYALGDEEARDLASQMLARLVNPAYQQLKQEQGRAEHAALLRVQVRRMTKESPLSPKSDTARQLIRHPASDVDVFYEQAVANLADQQYQPLDQFEAIVQQLGELNLVYLQLKMGEVFIREKRTGLVAATEAKPMQFTPSQPASPEVATESYAQRHYRRAQEYAKRGTWPQVIQELRDAIKLEADKGEYHALLGYAYLQQNLTGMATVHMRQALKLNPNDALATRYAEKLGIKPTNNQNGKSPNPDKSDNNKSDNNGGFFGMFRGKK